ncbi:MAG: hypothetical protein EOO01_23800 [Chitinophagaceae bacterium]|nr:MAG: hypothetical protein EOO01_23800 [Chitinophagaceae bacterium]
MKLYFSINFGTKVGERLVLRLFDEKNDHRDYNLNSWWFQSTIAIRLNKGATDNQIFNQPSPR